MSYEIVPFGKGKGKGFTDQTKIVRRTVDYGSCTVKWLQDCLVRKLPSHRFQCHYAWTKELCPPFATPQSPYDSICCRFVHASTTKNRAPVNVVHWFPNGRRLLSGTQTGEIIIWNGFQFHFENILQAHNAAVKAMEWTPEETVLVSGDALGIIKFWDQYLYNFQSFQAHKESICDISVAPTGLKFCSCADDSHAKVWDLRTGEEERAFTGHGWDVKCCAWHPTKGLVATGSKDSQIKLWDPRASEAITTIFCHKNTVTRVKWSPSGQWLASGSRDQLVMLMDIRTMSVRKVFKAHQKEVTSLCWHPESDAVLASAGYDSHMHFWDTQGASTPMESVHGAHDGPIWCLAWNPLGHLLVSGSHDYSTRFWSRARPGDSNFQDLLPKKVGPAAAEALALAEASKPPAPMSQAIFDAGIFAGPPLPPVTEEELRAEAEKRAAKKREAVEAEAQAELVKRSASGLSLGEGPGAKDVLDTSDFDAEEAATSAAKAKPVVPPVFSPPLSKAPAAAPPTSKATATKPPETLAANPAAELAAAPAEQPSTEPAASSPAPAAQESADTNMEKDEKAAVAEPDPPAETLAAASGPAPDPSEAPAQPAASAATEPATADPTPESTEAVTAEATAAVASTDEAADTPAAEPATPADVPLAVEASSAEPEPSVSDIASSLMADVAADGKRAASGSAVEPDPKRPRV